MPSDHEKPPERCPTCHGEDGPRGEEPQWTSDLGLRLTAWRITPTCQLRGHDVAWEDAVGRLKEVYDAQLGRFKDEPITLTVSIHRKAGEDHG